VAFWILEPCGIYLSFMTLLCHNTRCLFRLGSLWGRQDSQKPGGCCSFESQDIDIIVIDGFCLRVRGAEFETSWVRRYFRGYLKVKNCVATPKRSQLVKFFAVGASSLALFTGISGHATTYTVKPDASGNYTTIQACANSVAAGDTCTVYAGTYNETPNITKSGTSANRITITVNAGDVVKVYGFVVDANFVTVNGFYITDPSLTHSYYGIDIPHSQTGVSITNNTISQVGSNGPCIMTHGSAPSSYITISGNTINWCSAVPGQPNANASTGIEVSGDHFLIQNNKISHTTNGISGTEDHVVIRNNTWGPVNDPIDFPGCHETAACDTHADFLEVAASSSTSGYVLIERNNENNILGVGGAHFYIVNSTGTTAIDRLNTQYNVGSGYLGNNGTSANFSNWKEYNNTMIDNQVQQTSGGGGVSTWVSGPNGAFINNLMYNDVYPAGSKSGYYSVDSTSSSGFVSMNNLVYDSSCTSGTLSGCTIAPFSAAPGNIFANPMLVATDGSSFAVLAGSPAIAGGANLTTVSAKDSGSGTALVVNDANFFQDGWNIPGVSPDCISVTTVGNHACITSINYSTNTLTLSSSIQRAAGDLVWLYSDSTGRRILLGLAPTIGAPPSPPPPQGVTGTVQ